MVRLGQARLPDATQGPHKIQHSAHIGRHSLLLGSGSSALADHAGRHGDNEGVSAWDSTDEHGRIRNETVEDDKMQHGGKADEGRRRDETTEMGLGLRTLVFNGILEQGTMAPPGSKLEKKLKKEMKTDRIGAPGTRKRQTGRFR